MIKAPELVAAVVALVSIVFMDGVWRLNEIPTHTMTMLEADAMAAVARSQALPISHLGPLQ
jgi:hypothetical protein